MFNKKHKWMEVHKELTRVQVRSFFCGEGMMEVWLVLQVKYTKKGTYKHRLFVRSVTSGEPLQSYPVDYIIAKHPDSEIVAKLKKYGIS